MRAVLSVAVIVISVMGAAACRSTSAPSCTDQFGRGSDQPDQLNVTCAAAGSDLQCSAVATNTGGLYVYCPVTLTVTNAVSWTSSAPAVATFAGAPPGFLKVLAPGQVGITAAYGFLQGSAPSFNVAPGAAPERLIQVSIIVEHSVTGARVPDVVVEVTPARGAVQSCVTGQTGSCIPSPQVLSGTTRVRASKAGFQPVDVSLPPPTDSFFQSTIIKLVPFP
jgi:hypothetical protein